MGGHQPGLKIERSVYDEMVAYCLDGYPYEACGLLAAPVDSVTGEAVVSHIYPTRNAAASARVYIVDAKDHLRADRDAEGKNLEFVAVFHSHTHTEAYPSPTDVSQAPVPDWHYVLVSLAATDPSVRSFRIIDETISEEPVVAVGHERLEE